MNRVRGFTLMEVMIALTILSMMMVAIVSSLRTFANTQVSLERTTARVDEMRMVSGFLRRSVEATISSGGGNRALSFDAVEGRETYFLGMASEFTWVAPVAAGAGFGGVYFMHLGLEGDALTVRWQPYRSGVTPVGWGDMQARALLQDVQEYRVSYLPVHGGEWMDDWSDSSSTPVSVRMQIKAGEKYWPELLIRLN